MVNELKLINANDRKVYSNIKFLKNAEFFKDMFAFFDAYCAVVNFDNEKLPKYCFDFDENFSLDGICLLIKTYSSEFNFKTLSLSLDYLKVLYYSIASYSKNGENVSRDLLVNEYLVYKKANEKLYQKYSLDLQKSEDDSINSKQKYDKFNSKYAKMFVWSHILNILSVVVLAFGFISALLPGTIYFANIITKKSALIYALACISIGFIVAFNFKFIAKYLKEQSMDMAYELQTLKRNKDEFNAYLANILSQKSVIACQYYEFNQPMISTGLLKNRLTIEEIIKRANNSNFKTFNLKNDILNIAQMQDREINEKIDEISLIKNGDNTKFSKIYGEITEKDYLYFNNEIKLTFLNRFIENAKETNLWRLDIYKNQVNPFEIDVKRLFTERVAFMQNKDTLLLNATLDIFLSTKIAKRYKDLSLRNIKDLDSLNRVKSEYIRHFYDYEKLKNEKSLFSAKSNNINFQINSELTQNANHIPAYFDLKFMLINNRLNNNSLNKIDFENIFKLVSSYEENDLRVVKNKIDETKFIIEKNNEAKEFARVLFECDEINDLGNDEAECTVSGEKFHGFKLANVI